MFEVAIAIIVGGFGGFLREILGMKGIFIFPKFTEKNIALGGLLSVIAGAAAGYIMMPTYNLEFGFWHVSAFIAGLGWSDVLANVVTVVGKRG